MEVTLTATSQDAMQKIVDKEWEFVNKEYTDIEIRKLIKEYFKRAKNDKTFFCDRVYWWDTPDSFFKKEKTVLDPISKNYDKVIHGHLKTKDIDVNSFIRFFKHKGTKKHEEFIKTICSRSDIIDQFSEESVRILCAVYNYYKNEANTYNLADRIRPLIINSKDQDDKLFNFNREVVRFLETDSLNFGYLDKPYFSVLRRNDLDNITLSEKDLLYIINKLRFDLYDLHDMFLELDILLSKNVDSVTERVSDLLYKKLNNVSEYKFWNDIDFDEREYLLFKHLSNNHINTIIDKNYKKGEDNTYFLLKLRNSVKDKNIFSQKILSMILDDIGNTKDTENLNNIITMFTNFVISWEVDYYSEENTRKLYDLLVQDTTLALKMLSPDTYRVNIKEQTKRNNFTPDFSFIKKYIAKPLHEKRVGYITELLVKDRTLDSEQVLYVVGDVVNNLDINKIGLSRVYEIVDKIYRVFFVHQTKQDIRVYGEKCVLKDPHRASYIGLQFINKRLFHYLDEKAQYRILNKTVYEDFSSSNILNSAISDNYFSKKQFNYIWEKLNTEEKRFNLIGGVYLKNDPIDLEDNTVRKFNNYLEYNIDRFINFYFTDKKYFEKPDLIIDYICKRYSFESAKHILNSRYLFTKEQNQKLFNSFYVGSLPPREIDLLFSETDFYSDYLKENNNVEVISSEGVANLTVDEFKEYFFGTSNENESNNSIFNNFVCPSHDGKTCVNVAQLSYNDLLISSIVKDSTYPRNVFDNDSEVIYTRITTDSIDTVTIKQYKAKEVSERVLDLLSESMPAEEFISGYDYKLLSSGSNGSKDIYISEQIGNEIIEFTIKNPIIARDFIPAVREKVFGIKQPSYSFKDCQLQKEGVLYSAANEDGSYYNGAILVKK